MATWATIYDDCVAHYKLNDNAASTVVVESKAAVNGTSVRNTSLMHADGKVGGALEFLGDEETIKDYIDSNNTFQTVLQGNFTISLWVKPVNNDGMTILGFDENWNDIPFQVLYIELLTGQSIFFRFRHQDDGIELATAENIYNAGIWQMVTITYAKVGLEECGAKIYYNGIQVKEGTDVRGRPDIELETTIAIGAKHYGGDNQTEKFDNYAECSLDDVMIFNKALSAEEVLFLYENIARPIINTVVDGGDEDSVVINLTSAGTSQLYYRIKFATSWTTGLTDAATGVITQTGLTAGKWYEFYIVDDETNRLSNIVECEVLKSTTEVIEVAVCSLMANDGSINALVAARIYPNLVPQSAAMPAITYQEISSPREYTAQGATGTTEARFQINCWGSTYASAKSVAETVRKKLSGYSGTVNSIKIQSCFLVDEDDMPQASPETDVLQRFGKRQDYIITYNENLT